MDQGENLDCGGTIISPYHILTAAHCLMDSTDVKPADASTMKIYVGEHNRAVKPGSKGSKAVVHEVACFKVHPKFRPDKGNSMGNHDIAVMTLKKPIDLTSPKSGARAACLPEKSDLSRSSPSGTELTISGWGQPNNKVKKGSKILKRSTVNYINQADCKNIRFPYKGESISFAESIKDNHICASNNGPEETGNCSGDSGGPLTLLDTKVNKVKIVGVVAADLSPSGKCGVKGVPHLYERVTEYLDWINMQGVAQEKNMCGGQSPKKPNNDNGNDNHHDDDHNDEDEYDDEDGDDEHNDEDEYDDEDY